MQQGEYLITTDKSLMQPKAIHQWLSTQSYWAPGIPSETVQRAFDNSFCIGILYRGMQVGFARLITDYAVFGYLADVYVAEPHRGQGLSKAMMQTLMAEPWVKGLRSIMLATRDAQSLYAQSGFAPLEKPERYMAIVRVAKEVYPQSQTSSS